MPFHERLEVAAGRECLGLQVFAASVTLEARLDLVVGGATLQVDVGEALVVPERLQEVLAGRLLEEGHERHGGASGDRRWPITFIVSFHTRTILKEPLRLRQRDKARNKAAQTATAKTATRIPVDPQATTLQDDTSSDGEASDFEIINLDEHERFKRVIRLTLHSDGETMGRRLL